MKTEMWMKTGMMVAVIGACTLADAKQEKGYDGTGRETGQAGQVETGKKGAAKGHNREATMKKYDKDGDGQLNEEERAAAREAFEKKRTERESGDAD